MVISDHDVEKSGYAELYTVFGIPPKDFFSGAKE